MAEMGSNVGPQLKEWWFIKDDQVMNPDTTHASLHTELESRAACFCHVLLAFPGAFRVPPSSPLCSRPLGFVVRFVCDSVCPLTPYNPACTSSCGVESRHDQNGRSEKSPDILGHSSDQNAAAPRRNRTEPRAVFLCMVLVQGKLVQSESESAIRRESLKGTFATTRSKKAPIYDSRRPRRRSGSFWVL